MFEGEALHDTAFSVLAFDCSNLENCNPINKVIVFLKIMPGKHLKAKFNKTLQTDANTRSQYMACQALLELLVDGRYGQF